jgi:pectin methylesterase-like acyl-CoA thioesterase
MNAPGKYIAMVMLALTLVINLTSCSTMPPQTAMTDYDEAHTLQSAYMIIAASDHDYAGHRTQAMRYVRDAAFWLGLKLRGSADNDQPQTSSDAEMHAARDQIQSVLEAANLKGQHYVIGQLQAAVNEINLALSVN